MKEEDDFIREKSMVNSLKVNVVLTSWCECACVFIEALEVTDQSDPTLTCVY